MSIHSQITLRQFLINEREKNPPGLTAAIIDLARATRKLSYLVRRGAIGDVMGTADTDNVQGETQKKLDVISNDILIESLSWSGNWAALASEELEHSIQVPSENEKGAFLCLFDPLDGSSNIDINGSIGTIFSILPCPEGVDKPKDEDFLQAGTAQVSAGFVLYGPSTVMVLTTGHGVNAFTLETGSGDFVLTEENLSVPDVSKEFMVNMSNQRFWAEPMQRYVHECMMGTDSPRGVHFDMRYAGSMVADVYRILINGGIFLYPWDSKDPKKPSKLRLLYEANPMSFIVEQAGGCSSTGTQRIMEIQPDQIHQRCPVVLGSTPEVERVEQYHRESKI